MEPKPPYPEREYSPEEQQAFLDAVSIAVPELHEVTDSPLASDGETILQGAAAYDIDNTQVLVTETRINGGYHTITVRVAPPRTSLLNKISVYSYDLIEHQFSYKEKIHIAPEVDTPRIPRQATDNPTELARNALANAMLDEQMIRFLPQHYDEVMAILHRCSPWNIVTEP